MKNLKKTLLELEATQEDQDEFSTDTIEILADDLNQALELASKEFGVDISLLDYKILEKGNKGFIGLGRTPSRIQVSLLDNSSKYDHIEDLHISLSQKPEETFSKGISSETVNQDGKVIVRIYKKGIMLKIYKPKGNGREITYEDTISKIKQAAILEFDSTTVKKAVKNPEEKFIKIGNFTPKPGADSTLTIEVSPDEMAAFATISAPRPGGRHLTSKEVILALRNSGVVFGIKDDEIENILESDIYSTKVLVAEGIKPSDGADGYIDYKVKIDKKVEFKEDESGRIDFLAKNLVENVMQGQVLAELIPAEPGVRGKTVTDRIIPTESGKPVELKPGRGTILSENGKKLIADINGQAIYQSGVLHVNEVLTISEDVGLDTGNIMFLGSVIVHGSVTDNMQVKAAGNIEIGGSVQKAHLEAEGDIIIKQGVQGREKAILESTSGNLFAKFIQSAKVSVEKNLTVSEAIMHSKVDAGGSILANGKRAQLVGGQIMAGEEIRVKTLGASANTPTCIIVGTNPKILQQVTDLTKLGDEAQKKFDSLEQNIQTLTQQQTTMKDKFPKEKEEQLLKMLSYREKLNEQIRDIEDEKKQLREYMKILSAKGKVHIEKILYPGVSIEINGAKFTAKDEYNNISLIEEKGNIKIIPYEKPAKRASNWHKRSSNKN